MLAISPNSLKQVPYIVYILSTSCLLFVYFRSPGVYSIESSKRVNKELFEKSDFHSLKNTQTNTKIKLADAHTSNRTISVRMFVQKNRPCASGKLSLKWSILSESGIFSNFHRLSVLFSKKYY